MTGIKLIAEDTRQPFSYRCAAYLPACVQHRAWSSIRDNADKCKDGKPQEEEVILLITVNLCQSRCSRRPPSNAHLRPRVLVRVSWKQQVRSETEVSTNSLINQLDTADQICCKQDQELWMI